MKPTEEQQKIIEAAKGTSDSLLINALAGAAKTTTLVMIANNVLVPTFCGAFNKKIADEMGKRLPGHVQSSTMNSIGHRVWGQTIGKKLNVSTDKAFETLKELIQKKPDVDRKVLSEEFGSILRSIRLAKAFGYVPSAARSMGKSLIPDHDDLLNSLYSQIDVEITDEILEMIDESLMISIAQSFDGKIDFDDQIYMSALFGGTYPKYPLVMIDEAQDLSALNHVAVEKLVGSRLIAVGDPYQAIYGFRGAHSQSMEALKKQFKMTELHLSVSFRCPIKIVKNVHPRVPHMKWPEWAEEGNVERLTSLRPADIPNDSAIICRNNAPLFKAALGLIRAGRGVHLVGNDIGASLVKLMKKLSPNEVDQETFKLLIDSWENEQLEKAHEGRKASIKDRAECLRVFADIGKNSSEAIAYAEHLFSAAGPISLMTGHKSKGLEFDTVYHLDPWRVPSKWAVEARENGDDTQWQQEMNLKYVIETRAKKELFLIDLEDIK